MSLIDSVTNKIRDGLRNFLNITPAPLVTISLTENMDRLATNVKNRVWYRGKSAQLSELYSQTNSERTMFWAARPTKGLEIKKTHTGIPALIVDTLVNIVLSDFNGVDITSKSTSVYAGKWEDVANDNEFNDLVNEFLIDISVVGDGAFKVSFDNEISKLPIVEWYPAERVEFVYRRSRIREIIFYTDIVENNKKYKFAERYGYGYIKYELHDSSGKQINLHSISALDWMDCEGVTFNNKYMWAVPVLFGKSESFKGRGKGLLEDKEYAFDSLDEAWSQWLDALRACRTKQYIPRDLIPRDPDTGKLIQPNSFDNRFIETESDMREKGHNKITTESPTIQHESYLSTYVTALDLCLQGLISPSTLGIDTKKLDNAEAQREKEKTTLYTRQKFVELIQNVIPQLVKLVLNVDCQLHNLSEIEDIEVSVKFGEYANPSFESQVETIGKARQSGAMSIEQSVEELYGDSKSDAWKAEEVQRIKAEQGIVTIPEKSEGDDIPFSDSSGDIANQLLNGAQITSLMGIVSMIKKGEITRNEGLSIMTATLGISKDNAERFVEEQL